MTTYSQELTCFINSEGLGHRGWEFLPPLYQLAGMAPGCLLQFTGFKGVRTPSYNPRTGVWTTIGSGPQVTLTIPSTLQDYIDSNGVLVRSPYDAAYLAAYLAAGHSPASSPPFSLWRDTPDQKANIPIADAIFIKGNKVTISCDDYTVYAHGSYLIERDRGRWRGGPPPFSFVGDELTPP